MAKNSFIYISLFLAATFQENGLIRAKKVQEDPQAYLRVEDWTRHRGIVRIKVDGKSCIFLPIYGDNKVK